MAYFENSTRQQRLHEEAESMFERAFGRAQWRGFWDRLRHRDRQLPLLSDALAKQSGSERLQAGIHAIRVEKIVGTSGGITFDCDFLPTSHFDKDRWVSLAKVMLSDPTALPPIDVDQVGDHYYVEDGHHRVSVARILNLLYISADVALWTFGTTKLEQSAL